MRNQEYSTDLEVLRHYEKMRDSLVDFMDIWLSLDQLMLTEGYTHQDEVSQTEWCDAPLCVLNALERLSDIVVNAAPPVPMHWVRWRTDTALKVEAINDRLRFMSNRYMRP